MPPSRPSIAGSVRSFDNDDPSPDSGVGLPRNLLNSSYCENSLCVSITSTKNVKLDDKKSR